MLIDCDSYTLDPSESPLESCAPGEEERDSNPTGNNVMAEQPCGSHLLDGVTAVVVKPRQTLDSEPMDREQVGWRMARVDSGLGDQNRSMSDASARMHLNSAIEALLGEGSIEKRLFDVSRCIAQLEQCRCEALDGCLEILKGVINQLTLSKGSDADKDCAAHYLSSEQEFALSEELLSLYITASGGALIS